MRNYKKQLKKILALEGSYADMSDDQLIKQTDILKGRLKNGESLDQILPDAFAVVREASRRITGMFPYPVQLM